MEQNIMGVGLQGFTGVLVSDSTFENIYNTCLCQLLPSGHLHKVLQTFGILSRDFQLPITQFE